VTLRLYNTMSKQKEEFKPRTPGKVSLYVCGPTTYDYIHLGNARPLIVFDMVRRYLEYKGFEVEYIQNFTDIDDKIINRAKKEQVDALGLAAKYIKEFFKDAEALGVREADKNPKVSEHLPEIIDMIEKLVQKDFAYQVDGDVYYDVRKFEGYGKLSGRCLEDMQAGARVDVDQRKHHPMDFALWKSTKEGEPSWDSPWGKGRPGWHIECSAMSVKYLGHTFDIHGGGFDLIFPHHENEIAQTEACTGQIFSKYWMHNGFITVNEEKMSKSLGNFFTVREILKKYDPQVVRFYMLSTHYRSPLDFDDSKLEMNKKSLARLTNTYARLKEFIGLDEGIDNKTNSLEGTDIVQKAKEGLIKFQEAMDDDFNTALAIAVIFDLARETNGYLNHAVAHPGSGQHHTLTEVAKILENMAAVLGLNIQKSTQEDKHDISAALMELIIDIRQEARSKKDWATADKIRDSLKETGITLEDTSQGVRWKINQ